MQHGSQLHNAVCSKDCCTEGSSMLLPHSMITAMHNNNNNNNTGDVSIPDNTSQFTTPAQAMCADVGLYHFNILGVPPCRTSVSATVTVIVVSTITVAFAVTN